MKNWRKCRVPTPGIEPGPPGWKPGILTTRPNGKSAWKCFNKADIWLGCVRHTFVTTAACKSVSSFVFSEFLRFVFLHFLTRVPWMVMVSGWSSVIGDLSKMGRAFLFWSHWPAEKNNCLESQSLWPLFRAAKLIYWDELWKLKWPNRQDSVAQR